MEKDKSRKIVLDIVTPFFLEKGFQRYSEPQLNDMFYLNNNEGQITYGFYFKHVGWHTFFKASVNIKVVENILCDIYGRNENDKIIKSPTVFDNSTILGYEPALTPTSKKVDTQLDAKNMAHEIIEYVENIGHLFILNYSNLSNILKEINTLMKENKYWHQGAVGLGNGYFTGLIISKLCNDPDYENKFEYVMSLYSAPENNLVGYLPYLEKLKVDYRLNSCIIKR